MVAPSTKVDDPIKGDPDDGQTNAAPSTKDLGEGGGDPDDGSENTALSKDVEPVVHPSSGDPDEVNAAPVVVESPRDEGDQGASDPTPKVSPVSPVATPVVVESPSDEGNQAS